MHERVTRLTLSLLGRPVSLENLVMRYEEPSSMVRWDSPLFTVPWTDADVPADDIWRALTGGVVKPPNAGTQAVRPFPLPSPPLFLFLFLFLSLCRCPCSFRMRSLR